MTFGGGRQDFNNGQEDQPMTKSITEEQKHTPFMGTPQGEEALDPSFGIELKGMWP